MPDHSQPRKKPFSFPIPALQGWSLSGKPTLSWKLKSATPPNPPSQLPRAAWVLDKDLIPSASPPRAVAIAIGGFRECGPYHFQHIGRLLNATDIRVKMVSLFGHEERAAVPTTFTMRNIMSKAVHDVHNALEGVPESVPLVFIGFSMGALVALQAAQRFSFRPVAATITEGAYLVSKQIPRALYQWHLARQFNKLPAKEWQKIADQDLSYSSTTLNPRFRSEEWDLRPRVPVVKRGALIGIEQLRTATKQLVQEGKVRCPAFLAYGVHDQSAAPRSSFWLRDHLPQAEMKAFPHSAHSLALGPEQDKFNQWVCSSVESALASMPAAR